VIHGAFPFIWNRSAPGNGGFVMKKAMRFIAGCGPIVGTTILFCLLMLILALIFVAVNLVFLAFYSFEIPFALFLYVTISIGITMLVIFFAHCWYLKLRGIITIRHDDGKYMLFRGSHYQKVIRVFSNRDELIDELPEMLDEVA